MPPSNVIPSSVVGVCFDVLPSYYFLGTVYVASRDTIRAYTRTPDGQTRSHRTEELAVAFLVDDSEATYDLVVVGQVFRPGGPHGEWKQWLASTRSRAAEENAAP